MLKRHVLRFRKVNKDTFLAIKRRQKKVETRAATLKYRKIETGDVLVFSCGKERFSRNIKKIRQFKSIDSLLKKYKYHQINQSVKSGEELKKVYFSYPDYKTKIKKYGLLAFELK